MNGTMKNKNDEMTSNLTLAGLMEDTVRLFRSEQEVQVPRPVTSYSTVELWRLCLENTCDAYVFVWPFPRVERTEPGVVMMRARVTDLFVGPREFKGFVGLERITWRDE